MSMLVSRRSFVAAATTLALPYVWLKRAEADYIYQPWWQRPFRCIGMVETNSGSATGTMVGNRLVLTCAHVIYKEDGPNKGSSASYVNFTPGYNTSRRMRTFSAMRWHWCPGYMEEANKSKGEQSWKKLTATDLAVLILRQSPGVGFLGGQPNEEKWPRTVHHTGYPNIGNWTMYDHEIDIKVEDDMIVSQPMNHEIYKGMSGSPLYFRSNDDYWICGVHSRGGDGDSHHAKATGDLARLILRLAQEYP